MESIGMFVYINIAVLHGESIDCLPLRVGYPVGVTDRRTLRHDKTFHDAECIKRHAAAGLHINNSPRGSGITDGFPRTVGKMEVTRGENCPHLLYPSLYGEGVVFGRHPLHIDYQSRKHPRVIP